MAAEHHEAEEAPHGMERWLITYADMITLLLALFIVMYSMANTDLKKFAQVATGMQRAFHALGVNVGGSAASPLSGAPNGGGWAPR